VSARRRRRSLAPPRRGPSWRLLFALGGIAVAFVAGIGLGEALHDNPEPGGAQTLVRTLRPLPLVPVAHNTMTVTVTTSNP
jgi:hypothetical protein